MVNNFFNSLLQNIDSRIALSSSDSSFLLDKNEQSADVDTALKMQVLDSLLQADWNRYPGADLSDIECQVATYCGLQPENIVLGPGSANFITVLLNYFALNGKKITITQPSYSLFDYHCKTYNIPYTPWMLTPELQYDLERLPLLDANSVLFVTSPNNPVGNTIDQQVLEALLRDNPDALIVLDAVYSEFCHIDLTPLVQRYENLIVLRSFSKAFPIAGLRLGYLCAAPRVAAIVKKLVLQFSVSHFTLIFAREMLFQPAFMEEASRRVRHISAARDRMFQSLQQHFDADMLRAYPSEGNFLLIRLFQDSHFEKALNCLGNNGIKVLNTTHFPLLRNTFRVSIGNTVENAAFFECLEKSLHPQAGARPAVSMPLAPVSLPGPLRWTAN